MSLPVKSVLLFAGALFSLPTTPVFAAPVPICQSAATDSDGDGWGYEGGRSCRVVSVCTDTDGDGWGWDGTSSCVMSDFYSKFYLPSRCTDTDGDGWGWDGYRSCRTEAAAPAIDSAPISSDDEITAKRGECLDADGDGWGWNGIETCLPVDESAKLATAPPVITQDQCSKLSSGEYSMTELVTDVVLTAGQSNAAGNKTVFDPNHPLDQLNSRILAWTDRGQWEVANPLSQVWNEKRFPKSPGQSGFNHPAFQIARSIVQQDSCRVVAIVASSASGQPISYWLNDTDGHFSATSKKVSSALQQLPYKNKVDLIWWMQGESDNHPNYVDYNGQIKQLIGRYRSQPWFDSSRYFLANETGWFGNANKGIRLLADDGDNNTNYSANPVGIQPDKTLHIESEGATIHFNETALRIIGDLVRDEYLYDYRVRVTD